jgi:hypothetical protein
MILALLESDPKSKDGPYPAKLDHKGTDKDAEKHRNRSRWPLRLHPKMRKLFNHKKSPVENSANASPFSETEWVPEASPPGAHVCTSLCEGAVGIPAEYHESLIVSSTKVLGQTPTNLRIDNMSLNFRNMRIVEERDIQDTAEWRRDIEGNKSMSKVPLALPTTYEYPPLPKGYARFLKPRASLHIL